MARSSPPGLRNAAGSTFRVGLAVAAWLLTAIAGVGLGARADDLDNLSLTSRSVQTRNGTSRSVSLLATFDAPSVSDFDPREDAVTLTMGAETAFRIEPREGRWSYRRGKVRWRGGRAGDGPYLRRITVWPARGTLRAQVRGVSASGPLLGQDPLPVVPQLGDARFDGLFSTTTTTPRGTPVAFTVTDDWP